MACLGNWDAASCAARKKKERERAWKHSRVSQEWTFDHSIQATSQGKKVFYTNGAWTTAQPQGAKEPRSPPHTTHRNHSRWVTDRKVKWSYQTSKKKRERERETLSLQPEGKQSFLRQKTITTKEKTGQIRLHPNQNLPLKWLNSWRVGP